MKYTANWSTIHPLCIEYINCIVCIAIKVQWPMDIESNRWDRWSPGNHHRLSQLCGLGCNLLHNFRAFYLFFFFCGKGRFARAFWLENVLHKKNSEKPKKKNKKKKIIKKKAEKAMKSIPIPKGVLNYFVERKLRSSVWKPKLKLPENGQCLVLLDTLFCTHNSISKVSNN